MARLPCLEVSSAGIGRLHASSILGSVLLLSCDGMGREREREKESYQKSLVTFVCLTMYGQQGIKRSRRFVRRCNTSSGDKIYCKQACFILYGWTGGQIIRSKRVIVSFFVLTQTHKQARTHKCGALFTVPYWRPKSNISTSQHI